MNSIVKKVGARIKEYRCAAGLSQEEMAHRAGVSTNFLGDVERGKKHPSIEIVERLMNALGISLSSFFDFSENSDPVQDKIKLSLINAELQKMNAAELDYILTTITALRKLQKEK